jgi:biopolymer transport protein TolR
MKAFHMRRTRKPINQINVVPYIDVMLVLLVIFMITAPLVNPGQIELPSVGSKLQAPVAPLVIQFRRDGALALQDGTSAAVVLSRDDLIARIRDAQAKAPERPVVLGAAPSLRYEQVIDVIDMLQRNGVHKVGLLAKSQN